MAYTTIDDPSAYFHTQLYTGNGSSGLSITNDANAGDFQADLLWIMPRSSGDNGVIFDSNRGEDKQLKTNGTDAEDTHSPARVTIESDGFDLDTTDGNYNGSGNTYVSWQWKCNGGTTATNSSGDVTSTVQTNTTAGFSIVTYTGNGTDGASIGHGLSGAWDLIIVKNRGQTDYWTVDREPTSANNKALLLHDPSQQAGHGTVHFQGSNGLFTAHSNGDLGMGNGNTETYVAYVWKQIQGYSKFGTYTGNGNADGPFQYCGFKPAFIITKKTNGSANWQIRDNKRDSYNENSDQILWADITDTEVASTNNLIDFLSNGFKLKGDGGDNNGNGDTFFYMAFAEHPFVSSKGVPTTAR